MTRKKSPGSGLGRRDIAEFTQDGQITPFQLLMESLAGSFLAFLQELGRQAGRGEEAYLPSLPAEREF